MSLQVNDPRSRTRSKSPGRSDHRSRSRSRDGRLSESDLRLNTTLSPSQSFRPRSRSPAIVDIGKSTSPSRNRAYDPEEEAEIERRYKLMQESRAREREREREAEDREARNIATRAPRSPSRYEFDARRDDRDRGRERGDRYEPSGDDRDVRVVQPREYSGRSSQQQLPLPSPGGSRNGHEHRRSRSRRDSSSSSESSVDDDLAYGDTPGSHPSYARPGKFKYAQPTGMFSAPPVPARPSAPPAPEPPVQGSMPGAFPPASTYAEAPPTMAPSMPAMQYTNPASSAPYMPSHYRTASANDTYHTTPGGYAQPSQYQYAQVDPNIRYTSKAAPKPTYTASPEAQFSKLAIDPHARQVQPDPYTKQPEQPVYPYRYSHEPQFSDKPPPSPKPHSQMQQYVEITPGGGRKTRPTSLSVSSANNLAVAGALSPGHAPPASPLLEPYHGTYQSMSPMPSPIVIPSVRDEDISDLEPLDGEGSGSDSRRRKTHSRTKSSTSEKDRGSESRYRSSKEKIRVERDSDRKEDKRRSRQALDHHSRHDSSSSLPSGGDGSLVLISPGSGRKRVSFYDAEADAASMQSALNHTRNIDNKTILQVLPHLTSDEVLLLRQEYKHRVKVHGKGINLAKHLRLKLGNSSFGKVAYATALGRWESEAYWANCYYQAGTSRRELLIESLIGRSNAAIHEIKSCFRDTRYENSLEKCMKSELKADKFRVAVLLALEERRQDERDPLDPRLIRQDISDLHRALVSREGGETAMIQIIVLRSDSHLREVLRAYEGIYGQNFAKAMIAKSQNLVVCIAYSYSISTNLTNGSLGRNTSTHPQRRH